MRNSDGGERQQGGKAEQQQQQQQQQACTRGATARTHGEDKMERSGGERGAQPLSRDVALATLDDDERCSSSSWLVSMTMTLSYHLTLLALPRYVPHIACYLLPTPAFVSQLPEHVDTVSGSNFAKTTPPQSRLHIPRWPTHASWSSAFGVSNAEF
ncbi:hypothetical protein Hypma_013288 [Hypsizygus marmoreus]|uniref:Uncharacterized protein n=1 Tax=Hypsizygus marmoreus TaxID=39966 RepID=A0A369JJK8_HYPMA|nr:hypothetical protein Hypma_013288 [Hypsizygus marmoreus]